MKTGFIAFALLLASTQSLHAQVHVGLTAGINVTSVSSDYAVAEYDHGTRMAFGGIIDVPVSNRFSIRFEPKYSRKGSVPRFDFQQQEAHHNNHVDYISLPVLLAYSFPTIRDAVPFIELGPTVGIKVGADFHALLPGGLMGTSSADISDDIRSVDVGLAIGSGARIRAGSGWLQVTGRYAFSLSNMYDYPFDSGCADCTLPVTLGHQGFQVLVGYLVPVGTK